MSGTDEEGLELQLMSGQGLVRPQTQAQPNGGAGLEPSSLLESGSLAAYPPLGLPSPASGGPEVIIKGRYG